MKEGERGGGGGGEREGEVSWRSSRMVKVKEGRGGGMKGREMFCCGRGGCRDQKGER